MDRRDLQLTELQFLRKAHQYENKDYGSNGPFMYQSLLTMALIFHRDRSNHDHVFAYKVDKPGAD